MATATPTTMEQLMEQAEAEVRPFKVGDVVKGRVISIAKNEIWLDLGPRGTGFVSGREFQDGLQVSSEIKPGDLLEALVVDPENQDGYVILSLKRASREKVWIELEERMRTGEIITVSAFDANKGGLLIEVDGIRGFLPVSQLTPEHYPRVSSADKDEILHRLQGLVGKELRVKIIDVGRRDNKLIFSEKAAYEEARSEVVSKFKVGDVVEGRVTGVVDFGVFINFDGIEGLIHISEISWDRVESPGQFVSVGDSVKAKIISIEGDKISLSFKRLQPDPWIEAAAKFKVGTKVKGTVTRLTPFGAFVRVDTNIEALVHISELSRRHVEDPGEILSAGEEREFMITSIDPEGHKLALSLKALEPGAEPARVAPTPAASTLVLPGFSAATLGKLSAGGFDSVEKLRGATAAEIIEKSGVSAATAAKVVAAVNDVVTPGSASHSPGNPDDAPAA
jgi:small subunit ribosomal protein S1